MGNNSSTHEFGALWRKPTLYMLVFVRRYVTPPSSSREPRGIPKHSDHQHST